MLRISCKSLLFVYVHFFFAGVSYIAADSTVLRVVSVCNGIEPELNVVLQRDLLPFPGEQVNL